MDIDDDDRDNTYEPGRSLVSGLCTNCWYRYFWQWQYWTASEKKKIKLIKSKNDILPEVIPASQSKDSEPIPLDPLYKYHTSKNIHDDMDSSDISELDENEILRNVDNKNIYIKNRDIHNKSGC